MRNTEDKEKNTKTRTFSVRIPDKHLETIAEFADKKRWSINKAINYLTEVGLKEQADKNHLMLKQSVQTK